MSLVNVQRYGFCKASTLKEDQPLAKLGPHPQWPIRPCPADVVRASNLNHAPFLCNPDLPRGRFSSATFSFRYSYSQNANAKSGYVYKRRNIQVLKPFWCHWVKEWSRGRCVHRQTCTYIMRTAIDCIGPHHCWRKSGKLLFSFRRFFSFTLRCKPFQIRVVPETMMDDWDDIIQVSTLSPWPSLLRFSIVIPVGEDALCSVIEIQKFHSPVIID